MHSFVQMRQLRAENCELQRSLDVLRNEFDEKFNLVFQILSRVLAVESKSCSMGFIWLEKGQSQLMQNTE
jgi:hypothetical protein